MSEREPIIVSACLLGHACRYDGASSKDDHVVEFVQACDVVAICPEQMGGLPTPRVPCEIDGRGRVVDAQGTDRTAAFERGTRAAVERALSCGCTRAVLKAKSPSCGVHERYDGTFSGTLVMGEGMAARALREAGLGLLDENDVRSLTD